MLSNHAVVDCSICLLPPMHTKRLSGSSYHPEHFPTAKRENQKWIGTKEFRCPHWGILHIKEVIRTNASFQESRYSLKVVSVCVNGCNFFQWNVKFEKARNFSQSRDLTAKTRALLSHYKATLQFPFWSLPTLKLPLQSNPQLLVAAAQIFWFAWD